MPEIHVHLTSEPSESSEVVKDDGLSLLTRTKQSEGALFDQGLSSGTEILTANAPEHYDLDLRLRHALRECSGHEGNHFMPINDLDRIVCHDTIKVYLSSMDHATVSSRLQEITNYICGDGDESRKPHTGKRVFASLILANRADAVTVLHDEGINDEDLPLVQTCKVGATFKLRRQNSGDPILTCFEGWEDRDIQLFDKHQREMKPPFFAQGENSRPLHYKLSDRSCLPWTRYDEKIHSSKNSEVRCVGIHPAQHRLQPKVSIVLA